MVCRKNLGLQNNREERTESEKKSKTGYSQEEIKKRGEKKRGLAADSTYGWSYDSKGKKLKS